jgi:glycosyltransferase involved in cell wall biosynthesis
VTNPRTQFSICIPAYNRARHLPALLDSIYAQDWRGFEIVICEDVSRERAEIAAIAHDYAARYPGTLLYHENEVNLGYDGNIRRLVEKATGEYCFFMGNDDLICPAALGEVAGILKRHANVGLVLKSYALFGDDPSQPEHEIRYFAEERELGPGTEAISICFRRSGVISGYIVHRDSAFAAATDKFDGTLYYQMHITANVLVDRCAVTTPVILVTCRTGQTPDFGSSGSEKGKFVPGCYTPEARLRMVSGALAIVKNLREACGVDVVEEVTRDYANYFYPYIKDQLDLPFDRFMQLYRAFSRMGFGRYPMFHAYCALGYALGEPTFDRIIQFVRRRLGRSPQLSLMRRASGA